MFYSILSILTYCIHLSQFYIMAKVYHCSNCSSQYERPVGKKCQFRDQGESLPDDVEVAAPPSSDI